LNTKNPRRRSVLLGAVLLFVLAGSANDGRVHCTPQLTCAWRDAHFVPPAAADLGPTACDAAHTHCQATTVDLGAAHSCAITTASEVVCWGDDVEHQLGTNLQAPTHGATPPDAGIDVDRFPVALRAATAIGVGGAHTCALGADGAVRCWGRNAEGQVDGSASTEPVSEPRIVAVEGTLQLTAGAAHSCALVAQGVVCWGSARYGQVGRELRDIALGPELVPGTTGAVEVTAGARHTCARLDTGRVLCWGQLLDAETAEPRPTQHLSEVPGLTDARAISAGAGHSCALRASGQIVCWGENSSGQLGNGTTRPSVGPVAVKHLRTVLHMAAGGGERDGQLFGHTCAVDTGFHVLCWGANADGQLGAGKTNTVQSSVPVAVLGASDQSDTYLGDVTQVALGAFHSCALQRLGLVSCWGDDSAGQLGVGVQPGPSFGRAVRVARFDR
jgi:alpha-tubulin suppressor-like RCC1 family protein